MPPRAKKQAEPVEEYDPFAPKSDEPDEAQTELSPPWDEDNETDVNPTDTKSKEKVVSETPNETVAVFGGGDRLSVTLKEHKGYEASWIVLKGDTPADVLRTMEDPDFEKLMTWTKRASEKFQAGSAPQGGGSNTGQGGGGSQQRSQGRPSNATEHPKGKKEFCEHGEMEFKSGIGKNGKLWGGFDCKVDPKNCRGGRVWDNDFGK